MSLQMRFNEETAVVELSEQDTLMKSLKVAATKQFDLYMEDFEFRVNGRLVVDPEQFDPENDIFDICPKSGQLDVAGIVTEVMGKVKTTFEEIYGTVKSEEFKAAVTDLIGEVLRILKEVAGTLLSSLEQHDVREIVNGINTAIEGMTGLKNQVSVEQYHTILDQLKGFAK